MLACGCGIVAIIPAFQAGDESSILSTRTKMELSEILSPEWATISVLVPIWWHFTPKLEPISSEARKLSPDACASKAGTRPARKTAP